MFLNYIADFALGFAAMGVFVWAVAHIGVSLILAQRSLAMKWRAMRASKRKLTAIANLPPFSGSAHVT